MDVHTVYMSAHGCIMGVYRCTEYISVHVCTGMYMSVHWRTNKMKKCIASNDSLAH